MTTEAQGAQVPSRPRIDRVEVGAFTIPTDAPESDGTLQWDRTTLVVVEVACDGVTGLGYTYAHAAAAEVVRGLLAGVVIGGDPLSPPAAWDAMRRQARNLGRSGVVASAISAVDTALWDLKARILGVPLATLLGQVHEGLPVYGSGGFTSYDDERLRAQLAGWAADGLPMVKMKVGREPEHDLRRVAVARDAIGRDVELFVDANGAFDRKQALFMADCFADCDVGWFEEPVSSDDLEGLRLLRDRGPAGMAITAGEYAWDPIDARRLLEAGAVDVLQADVTRIGGITGLHRASALCEAHGVRLSAHTAPALHLHACCALLPMVHLEWFHDHVRIEQMLFDGVVAPDRQGVVRPDPTRIGHGLSFRWEEARRFAS